MKKEAFIFPILSGVLWGLTGVFVRYISGDGLGNLSIVFSRSAIAVIMMGFYIAVTDREKFKINLRDIWCFCGTGIIGMMGLNISYNIAIRRLSLALAAVLLALTPILVTFLAAVIFKEAITRRKIVCMFFAILGCVMVSGIFEQLDCVTISGSGVIFGIAAAVAYALYSTFSRISQEKGYHTYTIIFYSLLLVTIILLPFADYGEIGGYLMASPLKHTVMLLLHTLFASILPYIFYTLALGCGDTGIVSILAAGAEPASAAVFGMFFFAELPTPLSLAGLVITIAALAVLCLKK